MDQQRIHCVDRSLETFVPRGRCQRFFKRHDCCSPPRVNGWVDSIKTLRAPGVNDVNPGVTSLRLPASTDCYNPMKTRAHTRKLATRC
jgi:hypothetical protein